MKIPASKLVKGVEYPLWVLEFVRCPDGLYGIVVARDPKTLSERIPQPLTISQIIIDEKWIKDVSDKPKEEPKKKVLTESTTTKKPTTKKKSE